MTINFNKNGLKLLKRTLFFNQILYLFYIFTIKFFLKLQEKYLNLIYKMLELDFFLIKITIIVHHLFKYQLGAI